MKTFFRYIYDFIPIFFIIFIVFFPYNFVPFSYTVLGKFVFILILIYIIRFDIVLGIIFCLFLIYYYQQDEYENMLNMSDDILWRWTLETGKSNFNGVTNYQTYEYEPAIDLNMEYSKPEETKLLYNNIEFPLDEKNEWIYDKTVNEDEIIFPKNSRQWTSVILERFSKMNM